MTVSWHVLLVLNRIKAAEKGEKIMHNCIPICQWYDSYENATVSNQETVELVIHPLYRSGRHQGVTHPMSKPIHVRPGQRLGIHVINRGEGAVEASLIGPSFMSGRQWQTTLARGAHVTVDHPVQEEGDYRLQLAIAGEQQSNTLYRATGTIVLV